jgi:vitamin B12 transporter
MRYLRNESDLCKDRRLVTTRTITQMAPLVAALALQPGMARAQGVRPAPALPTFSLSVTESSELVEDVGTTRRLTRADIEARSARTLDEALRMFPGVYVRTGGDGTPRIDVRGFRSRHVLLLINGVPANSTVDGQFNPARISTAGIREIKISYGSSSVLYGDNALAAVIEITTVDNRPDAVMEVSAGTPESTGVNGRYAHTAGQWSLTTTGTVFNSEGYRLPDSFTPTLLEDGGRRDNSDRARRELRGALGYRASPAVSLASEWAINSGHYGVPTSIISDSTDTFAQTPRFERVTGYQQWSGQLSATFIPAPRFHVRAWGYRNAQRESRSRYDDNSYTNMDDPLVSGTFQTRERTNVTGSTVLGRLDLASLGWLRLAVNQRRESFDARGVVRDVALTTTTGSGGGGNRGGSTTTRFDVRDIASDEHVDVYSTGAEWEAHPATRVGTVLGGALNMQRRPDQGSRVEPTWLAGLTVDPTASLRLHASASRKVRVPSIDQLYNSSSGNPALRAEHAYSLDAGADQQLAKGVIASVSLFQTNAHEFIEREASQPFENHDDYRFRGIELTLQGTGIRGLALRGGYSLLDSDDMASGLPLQTRPRHRGMLDWVWTPLSGVAIRGALSVTGTQLYDARGSSAVQRKAEGFTLVDLGATYTLARQYDIVFDVSNLFDELYDQSYGVPREGRAAVLSLRARWQQPLQKEPR